MINWNNLKPTQISVHNPIFGPRNLGHYFGSMKDLVHTQYEYNSIVVIDDLMATFMNPRDFKHVRNRSFFVVQDFINAGFDYEENHIILTSQIVPQLMDLVFFYSSVVEVKYCSHLYESSFLGGLKMYQRKEIDLSKHPSVFEFIYPQFGMPAISLGLNVELFQGGEEIMGYVYIMQEIVQKLKDKTNLNLFAPAYEPSTNKMVLGIDGRYMFQDNSIYLCEDEESIYYKIDQIQDKRVIIDWFRSLGKHKEAENITDNSNLGYEKNVLREILLTELKPFREQAYTNNKIIEILNKSKLAVLEKIDQSIHEIRSELAIEYF